MNSSSINNNNNNNNNKKNNKNNKMKNKQQEQLFISKCKSALAQPGWERCGVVRCGRVRGTLPARAVMEGNCSQKEMIKRASSKGRK